MSPEIRTTPLCVTLTGVSLRHDAARTYGHEYRMLLDRLWPAIKAGAVRHKGINWGVYGPEERVFAGVEAETADHAAAGLESISVRLDRYAWGKQIGPYQLIPGAYAALHSFITARGLVHGWPQIEIYSHWTSDESKLETELLIPVR